MINSPISDLREHSIVVVAGGGSAFSLLAGARVRVHRAPAGHGSGRRVKRRVRRLRRRRVLGLRGADWGDEVTVVVGHRHVMHVAAVVVVAVTVEIGYYD